MRNKSEIKLFKVNVQGKTISIWVDANTQQFEQSSRAAGFGRTRDMVFLQKIARYSPEMRFVLINEKHRLFSPERHCYRGSFENWISIGKAAKFEKLLEAYLIHLGKHSFYDLY